MSLTRSPPFFGDRFVNRLIRRRPMVQWGPSKPKRNIKTGY